MITEIQKSINSILYERVASPFFGALTTSWLVWNWKIIYLTLFVSESKIKVNKIDYIIEHFYDGNILITYPLISTFVLLTVIPFISNGAYWLHIYFNKWKTDQKHKLEMTALLTNEQSILLREELQKKKEQIEKLLEGKDLEIKLLNIQLDELKNNKNKKLQEPQGTKKDEIINKVSSNDELNSEFRKIVQYIQNGNYAENSGKVSSNALAFFESNHLVRNKGEGKYELTILGEKVLKKIMDKEY